MRLSTDERAFFDMLEESGWDELPDPARVLRLPWRYRLFVRVAMWIFGGPE